MARLVEDAAADMRHLDWRTMTATHFGVQFLAEDRELFSIRRANV
jgi:hypothetical protein